MGSMLLMTLSSSVSTLLPSFHSVFLPKTTGTGMNLQYLPSSWEMRPLLANSSESSSRYRLISVPRSSFLPSAIEYSGEPSQDQCTGLAPSCQLRVSMVTFLLTMKAE